MNRVVDGPLSDKLYELCQEIEKLPNSDLQSQISARASEYGQGAKLLEADVVERRARISKAIKLINEAMGEWLGIQGPYLPAKMRTLDDIRQALLTPSDDAETPDDGGKG